MFICASLAGNVLMKKDAAILRRLGDQIHSAVIAAGHSSGDRYFTPHTDKIRKKFQLPASYMKLPDPLPISTKVVTLIELATKVRTAERRS